MKDILMVFVLGIIIYGTYKLFELFVRRRERLALIEKLGDSSSVNLQECKLYLPQSDSSLFTALKLGSLFSGMGIGILIGFFICNSFIEGYATGNNLTWNIQKQSDIVYGSCMLLFGGLGLLVAFVFELLYTRKNKH